MKKLLLLVILFVLGLLSVQDAAAQIIDDTTKLLYGPRTTLQLLEQHVLQGRYQEQRIDTTIQNMNNERYWFQDTTFYQHLGNVGTAAQPILFRPPQKIGVRLGKNIFDRYAYDPEKVNYFETRSPYTHLYYVQGARGEQVFEAVHTRNIKENWNAGVAYRIISAQKQINARDRRQRGLVNNQAVKLFTHYRSTNDKYDLFANFTSMNANHIEQGGIRPDSVTIPLDSLFNFETEVAFLDQATNEEKRRNFHLMHIYKLAGEDLKLYHTLDWHRQYNRFQDDQIARDSITIGGARVSVPIFYPRTIYTPNRTEDETNYKEFQNVFGVTGNNKLSFYKAYLKYRTASNYYQTNTSFETDDTEAAFATAEKKYDQLFVGGQLRVFYENKAELTLDGEFQISTDYRVKGTARVGGLQASLQRVLISPTVTEQYMLSNHFTWDNNFNNSVTDRIEVAYAGKLGKRQYVKLMGHYTNIKRYIYFGVPEQDTNEVPDHLLRDVQPIQTVGNQRLFGAELSHHINFGPLHFENFVAYTNTDEASNIRIPEILVDSKLYFQGFLFKQALYGQIGLHGYMPTSYFADAYMPVIQQFYNQDLYKLDTYPVLDAFVTVDIKNMTGFLKMGHVNDGIWKPGYFVTPLYPGMRRSFVFGIKWRFFD